jgi:hypothetical protein
VATEQAGVSDIPDAWEREAWVAVTVTGGAQVAAWRPRPWLPGYLIGSHFFIVDGCGYLFREGFWEFFGNFFGGVPHAGKRRELIQDLRFAPAWMDPICRELVG